MRNLRTIALDETLLPAGPPLTATAWDIRDDSIICAFGPTPTQPVIELKRKRAPVDSVKDADNASRYETITSWDAPCPLPDLECDEILLLQYFADMTTACLVLAGGDLVIVRENPAADQEKIEIVGTVDAGIAAAAWAPDEELLAIVTRVDTLILMSRDFEPVTEANLSPEDLKASKHVSVGWGKKETQFQGKRAKALRDPTMPESVDDGKLSPLDDGKVSVSWRGDGAFLAINSIVKGERRVIRVFTREAVLDSASEPVDGLEGALTWRPAGNLLAGVQRHDGRIDIVFFERNGLKHGGFQLRLSKEEMKSWGSSVLLSWNKNSSVLAVAFTDRIQLWNMGNYHYYLKQEVSTHQGKPTNHPLKVRWHAEQPLRCAINTVRTLLDIEYGLATCRGSTAPPYDHGSVAVIDGKQLKLTPLRYANVPPPMSFCEIEACENIVDCAVSRSSRYVAILTSTMVEVYKWHELVSATANGTESKYGTGRLGSSHTLEFQHPLKNNADTDDLRYTQVKLRGEHDILIVAPSQRGVFPPSAFLRWRQKGSPPMISDHLDPRPRCQTATVDIAHESLWAQADGKTVATVGKLVGHQLPGDEPSTEIVRLGSGGSVCKISMSRRGELYANTRFLARGCTSFLVTDQHLIFTTSSHFLKVVHLRTEVGQLEIPPDTPEVDERCRSIERGAVLITVIPSTYAVVLQMPRGNLETIFPRVLVVAGIRGHLLAKDYRKAFLACQSHQVDLNILHDYRPDIFMENVELFVDQMKKPSRVDEFLSKLMEEDVSQTMYKDTLRAPSLEDTNTLSQMDSASAGSIDSPQSKINKICDAFLATIQRKDPSRHQNLITAYVSRRPSDFVSALSLISDIRKSDTAAGEKAVAHLVFLSDAARLYNVALSTYDLELTVSVAENAQMDPREYLPFLERLHAMDPLQRQYEIDNHLRNYGKALKWLYAQGKHEEVKSYTVKHNLYPITMDLYRYSAPQLRAITHRYAEYLSSQSRYMDAAMAFESLDDYSSAYPLYALAHHWREALASASRVPLETEQLLSLATSLSRTLAEETRDYRSAASIHIDYLQDVVTGSRLLCKGSYFAEATRVLALHEQVDKIPDIIDPGLAEKFGEITELLADCKGQMNAQVPRIKDLRVKKAEDPLAFFGGDPTMLDGDSDIPDNISLAATDASTAGGQSLFTRYGSNHSKFGGTTASNVSHKTSKTKRREERKRARGKKGSVYEEEYLIASVARLIARLNGVQDEVRRLTEGLLRRGMRERAKAVDESMVELMTLCERAKEELWPDVKKAVDAPNEDSYEVNGEGRPRGGEGVLWDSQMESQETKQAPVVKEWTTVGLLAS